MNLYQVTCDNGESWEDHDHYTMCVRAKSEEDACAMALIERGCSQRWSAEASVLLEDIDGLEWRAAKFEGLVSLLRRTRAQLWVAKSGLSSRSRSGIWESEVDALIDEGHRMLCACASADGDLGG